MIQLAGLLFLFELTKYAGNNFDPRFVLFKAAPGGTGKNRTWSVNDLADFSGYAAKSMAVGNAGAWATITGDSQDHGKAVSPTLHYEMNQDGEEQTIYGIGILVTRVWIAADDYKLFAYWDFNTPVILNHNGAYIERVVTLYDDDYVHPNHG